MMNSKEKIMLEEGVKLLVVYPERHYMTESEKFDNVFSHFFKFINKSIIIESCISNRSVSKKVSSELEYLF